MHTMALPQPGSAEKTIRKIDIAQVSLEPLGHYSEEGKKPYRFGPAGIACLQSRHQNLYTKWTRRMDFSSQDQDG